MDVDIQKKKRFTKKELSWILYDWANSVYATNIMAAIFPVIFVNIAGEAGDIWWGYATAAATFLIAILAPILGAIADFKGMKKKLFTGFMLAGVIFTALIACTNNWKLMLIGYVLSRIGFSASNLFYDSFLTDVTDSDHMDKVSSWGYAMGYIGGSTIPFIISIIILLVCGFGSAFAQKFSIIITSIWWLVFTIPFLCNVHQEHYIDYSGKLSLSATFKNILATFRDMIRQKGLLLFTIAYFFYIDGVGTIISISTAYGSTLGLGQVGMILALLVTQLVAMPCSILFARLSEMISARKALIGAICIYIGICMVGFYMGFTLEPHQKAYEDAVKAECAVIKTEYQLSDDDTKELEKNCLKAFRAETIGAAAETLAKDYSDDPMLGYMEQAAAAFYDRNAALPTAFSDAVSFSTILFWAMAVLVGTVQGGIQAVSRSYFGKLIPKERSNEFFGFFDIFGKFASVLGPFLYSTIGIWTGRSSYGVLCLAVLFLIGLIIMVLGKKQFDDVHKSI